MMGLGLVTGLSESIATVKSIRGDSSLLLSVEDPEHEAPGPLTWFPPGKAEIGAADHLCKRRACIGDK